MIPVNQNFIPALPQIPYRNGVGAWEGVVMHQTANPDDTAKSEENFEAGDYKHAFVHEFVDPTQVLQVADANYLAYGAGPAANARFIHIELCHADDQASFEVSFDAWCQRAAAYLFARHLGVTPAQPDGSGTLWAHADVSHILGGTDHTDPIEYLAKWGKAWEDVVARVTDHYNALAAPVASTTPAAPPTAPAQWKVDAVTWLKDQGLIEQDHNPDAAVTWAELGVVLQRFEKIEDKGEPQHDTTVS